MENAIMPAEKATPKHVFLHLFVIIMLYASTANFITLMFQYTNFWVADPLTKTTVYFALYNAELIRFALAAIIIIFPVFILTSRYLNKSYVKNPAVREMRIRKWLIYFTLFVSALIIVGDLVSITLTFLNGEATLRFILKALSMLLVTGLIFFYYLRDLKDMTGSRGMHVFVWGVIAAVAITIVAGFFIVGSPKMSRARRFDYERLSNLQEAQMQIINYWQSKERLPVALTNLSDNISGYQTPMDPETGAAYEYVVISTTSFKLCATFNLASDTDNTNMMGETPYAVYPAGKMENWAHEAGHACFERTIDPELYKQFEKMKY